MKLTMLCMNGCGTSVPVNKETFDRLKAGEDVRVICCLCTIKLLPNSPEMLELWIHMKVPKYKM